MIEPATRIPPADTGKEVTSEYLRAINLNRRIITAAHLAQQNLYDMCAGFKEMRDENLYKELGYASFEEYCEKETGFQRRQVYNYISIVEKLPQDFVQSIAQIGMTKLHLLTTISEEEREEITASVDLESASVRKLEAEIKDLKSRNETLETEKIRTQKLLDAEIADNESVSRQRDEYEERLRTLEKEPVEVATQYVDKIPDDYIHVSALEREVAERAEERESLESEFIAEKRRAHAEKLELEAKIAELEKAAESGSTSDDKRAEIFALLDMSRYCLSKAVKMLGDNTAAEISVALNYLTDYCGIMRKL